MSKNTSIVRLNNSCMSYGHLKVVDIFTVLPQQQTSLDFDKYIIKDLDGCIHDGGRLY